MAELLPPELWYIVVRNIHCVLDRAEISKTCTVLHNIVSDLPQPAPLLAFRSYHDKLASCEEQQLLNPPKILSLDALLRMKELVTKDRLDGHQYEPHFIDLLIKWVETTKPSESVIASIWDTIVLDQTCYSQCPDNINTSMETMPYEMYLVMNNLRDCLITNPNVVDQEALHKAIRQVPVSDFPVKYHGHYIRMASSRTKSLNMPLALFKEVTDVGHVVLDKVWCDVREGLTLDEEGNLTGDQSPCTHCTCRDSWCFLTLAIESGYYVIRNSTKEECRELCKNECFLKHEQIKPVIFYAMDIHWEFRLLVSMTLNRKEVIDEMMKNLTLTGRSDDALSIGFHAIVEGSSIIGVNV